MTNNVTYVENNAFSKEALLAIHYGDTPLLWGIANSNIEAVLALLSKKDQDSDHLNQRETESHNNTPLILSIAKGWEHKDNMLPTLPQSLIAIRLLELNVNVHAVDRFGRTALHYACLHRNIDAIKALIQHEARWSDTDQEGLTPLDLCQASYNYAASVLKAACSVFTLNNQCFDNHESFFKQLSSIIPPVDDKQTTVINSIDKTQQLKFAQVKHNVELALKALEIKIQDLNKKHSEKYKKATAKAIELHTTLKEYISALTIQNSEAFKIKSTLAIAKARVVLGQHRGLGAILYHLIVAVNAFRRAVTFGLVDHFFKPYQTASAKTLANIQSAVDAAHLVEKTPSKILNKFSNFRRNV